MADNNFDTQFKSIWSQISPGGDSPTGRDDTPPAASTGTDLISQGFQADSSFDNLPTSYTPDVNQATNKANINPVLAVANQAAKETADLTSQRLIGRSVISSAAKKATDPNSTDSVIDKDGIPYIDMSLGKKLAMVDLLSNADNPYVAQVLPGFLAKLQLEQQLKNKAASELLGYQKMKETNLAITERQNEGLKERERAADDRAMDKYKFMSREEQIHEWNNLTDPKLGSKGMRLWAPNEAAKYAVGKALRTEGNTKTLDDLMRENRVVRIYPDEERDIKTNGVTKHQVIHWDYDEASDKIFPTVTSETVLGRSTSGSKTKQEAGLYPVGAPQGYTKNQGVEAQGKPKVGQRSTPSHR